MYRYDIRYQTLAMLQNDSDTKYEAISKTQRNKSYIMMLSPLSRHGCQKVLQGRIVRFGRSHGVNSSEDIRRMSVFTLSDLDAVSKFVQLNSKCCIYYTADWCGPCQAIKPVYKDLAAAYTGSVALGMVNVDDNPTAAAEAKVSSIPTFTLFHNTDPFQTFTGADSNKLRESLSALAAK